MDWKVFQTIHPVPVKNAKNKNTYNCLCPCLHVTFLGLCDCICTCVEVLEMLDTPPQILGECHEFKICTCTICASIPVIIGWVSMFAMNEPLFTKATPAILVFSIDYDVTEHLVLMLILAIPSKRKS